MLLPIKYQQEAYQHATEVRKVRHTIDDEQSHKQLYCNHSQNEPPILYTHQPLAGPAAKQKDCQEDNKRIIIKNPT